MLVLYLALIGLPVGLVLDALIVRLAVPPHDEDEAEEPPAPELTALHAPAGAHGAEAGSLLLSPDQPTQAWARRSLVLAATAGLFALAGARYDDPSHLALVSAYLSALLLCAATDTLSFRVPNAITYPAILTALVAAAVMPQANFLNALAGGAFAGGLLLLPALFTGGAGMGMGDVKLAAFAGLALGFTHIVPALLFMALAGGAVAAFLLLTGTRKRGEPIPYAPFIAAGAMTALLWQGTAFVSLT